MKLITFLAVVGLAAAWPQTGDIVMQERSVVQRRDVTVTQAELDTFKFFAQYVVSTGCNSNATAGTLVTCTNNTCPAVTADGVVVQMSFDANTITNQQGYISLDPTRSLIVVAYRGSTSIRNYLADILFLMGSCDNLAVGCAAHLGFLNAWGEVQDATVATVTALAAANPTYSIVVVGYSLGGAVGTLAAAHLRVAGFAVDLYTFGSPRVGNDVFADFVTAQAGAEYRVTHLDDPVPNLPPMFVGYRHTSPEYWLSDGNATTTDYDVSDIKVCEGNANATCNAGQGGFDTEAHNYYLEYTAGCSSGEIEFKRDVASISDEDLEARLKMFSALDIEYAAALAEM